MGSSMVRTRIVGPHLWLPLATLTVMLSSFLVSKVIALLLGPEGVGYQAALLSLGTVIGALGLFGLDTALPKWMATRPEVSPRKAWRLSLKMAALTSAPALAVGLVVSIAILGGDFAFTTTAAGLTCLVVASVVAPIQRSHLALTQGSTTVAAVVATGGAVSAASTIFFLMIGGLPFLPLAVGLGALVGQLSAQLVGAYFRRRGTYEPLPQAGGSGEHEPADDSLGSLLRLSGGYFATVGVSQLALGILPFLVVAIAGPTVGGLFKATLALGALPLALTGSMVSYRIYPQFLVGEDHERVLRTHLPDVLLPVALASSLVALLAGPLIQVFFTSEFRAAAAGLAVVSASSSARILQSANTYLLLARGRTPAIALSQWSNALFTIAAITIASLTGDVFVIAFMLLIATVTGATVNEVILRSKGHRGCLRLVMGSRHMLALVAVPTAVGLIAALFYR